jgi:DNA-binding Xre family transcriptional regulator
LIGECVSRARCGILHAAPQNRDRNGRCFEIPYYFGTMSDMRGSTKKKGRIGSSFDDFLKQEGIYEGVTARAIKRVIARQLDALMQEQGISKTELAKSMKTSRAQLDRLLDPENESVTLGTLTRAAQAVGRNLRMELV